MRLDLDHYKSIALGCAGITEENGRICFHRFTEGEELFYKKRDLALGKSFSDRCRSTAGIRLRFITDSRSLGIAAKLSGATSRSFFSFDVYENGKLLGYLDNFREEELLEDYTEMTFPLGWHRTSFTLSEGRSEITVVFPWSVSVDEIEIELDDGAAIEPVKPKKRLLAYGDSITQGCDALRPSERYTARLAELLDAEEINKAIGGEIFVPELVKERLDPEPDYISVAYGTNDWGMTDGRDFYQNVKSFYTNLRHNYPNAQIFAITPIWRANFEDKKPLGDFFTVERVIKEVTAELKGVTLISGFDLVGHDRKLFADLRLHPRDEGFREYFENLARKIGEIK